MPVKLYSGLPGAGKTAQMVAEMVRYMEEEPDRPRFQMGVRGLLPSVATELTMAQLERWWEALPTDSVIFIDEAQEDHLMPLDRGQPKDWVKRIRKVRHEGMDFVLTVQHPADLSPTVRRLVDQHVHTVRKFNTKVTMKYTWGRCMDRPENERTQRAGVESIGTLPANIFDLYQSSNSHNMKVRIPRKVYYFAALVVLALASVIAVPFVLRHAQAKNVEMIDGKTAVGTPGQPADSGRSKSASDELRQTDFAKWMRPRIDGLPWSAPMFDNLQVQAQPRLFCVAVEDGRCSCMTEQGTRYAVPLDRCRSMVADGVYNPFQSEERQRQGEAPSRPASVQPQAPPTAGWAPTVAGVGTERERQTATPYVPPTYGKWDPDPFGSAKK